MKTSELACIVLLIRHYKDDEIQEVGKGRACNTRCTCEKCMLNFCGKTWKGSGRHGWEDNIKIDHTEILWEVVDLFSLEQDFYFIFVFILCIILAL